MNEEEFRNALSKEPGFTPKIIEELIQSNRSQKRIADLCFAMRTRVLTQEEHDEAIGYGEGLLIFDFGGKVDGREEARFRLFNEMWLQQYRLRALQTSPNH